MMQFDIVARDCLKQLRKIEQAQKRAVLLGVRRTAYNIKRKITTAITTGKEITANGGWGRFPEYAPFSQDAMRAYQKKRGGAWGKSARVWIRGSGEKDLSATIGFPAGVKKYAEQWQTPGYRLDALAAARALLRIRDRLAKYPLQLYSTMDKRMVAAAYAEARKKGLLDLLEYKQGLPPLQPERPKREVINAALEAYADRTVRAMVEKMLAEACK